MLNGQNKKKTRKVATPPPLLPQPHLPHPHEKNTKFLNSKSPKIVLAYVYSKFLSTPPGHKLASNYVQWLYIMLCPILDPKLQQNSRACTHSSGNVEIRNLDHLPPVQRHLFIATIFQAFWISLLERSIYDMGRVKRKKNAFENALNAQIQIIFAWVENHQGLCSLMIHSVVITKTYLYNFDPLKPHFYIVKLGFTGVYIIFLISSQKYKLWILVRTASAKRFKRVPTIYILSRNMINFRIFLWKLSVFGGEISIIFTI